MGFEVIRQSPLAGRGRDELREGLRSRRIEHHIAYYLVSPKAITIAAILHERMDPHKHL